MRTSKSHPLRVDWLDVEFSERQLGLTFAPGKVGDAVGPYRWERDLEGDLEPGWVATDRPVQELAVAEHLRKAHGLSGFVHEFHVDEVECTVIFKAPAYTADAIVARGSGHYTLQETRRGAMALLDDLHKGRHAGPVWSLLIDIAAAVTALSAGTGLWLLFYVKRWRRSGLVVTLLGAVALVLAWALGIP